VCGDGKAPSVKANGTGLNDDAANRQLVAVHRVFGPMQPVVDWGSSETDSHNLRARLADISTAGIRPAVCLTAISARILWKSTETHHCITTHEKP
jgi:hypothetical protein